MDGNGGFLGLEDQADCLHCRDQRDLLRAFLPLAEANAAVDGAQLRWMVAIYLTFVLSGVLLATTDWISSRVNGHRVAQGTRGAHE
jgi:hypothetical protein